MEGAGLMTYTASQPPGGDGDDLLHFGVHLYLQSAGDTSSMSCFNL